MGDAHLQCARRPLKWPPFSNPVRPLPADASLLQHAGAVSKCRSSVKPVANLPPGRDHSMAGTPVHETQAARETNRDRTPHFRDDDSYLCFGQQRDSVRKGATGQRDIGGPAGTSPTRTSGRAGRITTAPAPRALLKAQSRQDWRALLLNGVEAAGIEAQCLKDSGSDLRGLDEAGHRLRLQARIRNQDHLVSIVLCEAAVLCVLLVTSRVDRSGVRLHDNVGCARSPFGGRPGLLYIVSIEGP